MPQPAWVWRCGLGCWGRLGCWHMGSSSMMSCPRLHEHASAQSWAFMTKPQDCRQPPKMCMSSYDPEDGRCAKDAQGSCRACWRVPIIEAIARLSHLYASALPDQVERDEAPALAWDLSDRDELLLLQAEPVFQPILSCTAMQLVESPAVDQWQLCNSSLE